MFKYTAIEKTAYIDSELKRYIRSTFMIEHDVLAQQFHEQIDEVELIKGPYISLSEPFKTGSTINQLMDDQILNNGFRTMPNFKLDRPLYHHQESAIRLAKEGKNLVVSTGTGSGKTESFLIPIINKILEDRDRGVKNCGVQALLLYPMNALANDQRQRVRDILKNNPEITFGFYTGETFEKEKKAIRAYDAEYQSRPLKNEIISREQLRKTPPNILFTNFSMLEYILLRPFDDVLFDPKFTKYWRYIVMDEAHIYRGSLGIEISLLIRRLLGRIQSDPQFILTSATLAQGEKDYPLVVEFAKKLTSKHFDNNSIITSVRNPVKQPDKLICLNRSRYIKYLEDDRYIQEDYNDYFNKGLIKTEEQLYQLIVHDTNYYDFKNIISRPMQVEEIKNRLSQMWSDNEITALIDNITRANRIEDKFLIDIRYHTFVKALDGAYVVIKPKPKLYLKNINTAALSDDPFEEKTVKTYQLGLCKYCKSSYLMGAIVDNKFYKIDDEELYERYEERIQKETHFLLIKEFVENLEDLNDDEVDHINLCNQCGHVYDAKDVNKIRCDCGEEYLIETVMLKDEKSKSKTNLHKCISCGATNSRGVIESFYIGKDAATTIVAQILYKSMGKINQTKSVKKTNPFAANTEKNNHEAYVKQFIAFSDSRQQASYFALYFDEKHEAFMRKRLIVDALANEKYLNAKLLLESLEYMIEKHHLFASDDSAKRNAWITYLIDLLDLDRKFSLSGLGLVAFIPNISFQAISEEDVKVAFDGMDLDTFKSIVYFIIDSLRSTPAIEYSQSQLTHSLLREHLLYRYQSKRGIVLQPKSKDKNAYSLLSTRSSGNKFTNYLMKALNIEKEKAEEYLKMVWNFLTSKDLNILKSDGSVYKYDALQFKIYNRKHIKWYQCQKCNTLTHINVNKTCVKSLCDGKLFQVDPDEINQNNFYFTEYLSKEIENIRVEEHTAQLTHQKGREYQNDFKSGKINVLSSSTTFEMGVDIGNLDTIYMRNVPPTPANYVQRAGRAGRRKETAAYILTFSSNQSHDYNFFKDPIKMIEGKINPPIFEVKNKKIIERHILSVALSMFFKENESYFDNISNMVFKDGKSKFKEYLNDNKNEFINFISKNIESNFEKRFDEWLNQVFESQESSLDLMLKITRDKISQIDEFIELEETTPDQTKRYMRMKKNILDERTLNVLSRYSVIPKYGFPVDTVTLEIPLDEELELARDLAQAISEYAPDSEVIANKRKYRSRYINMGRGMQPIEYHYKICNNCKSLSMSISKTDTNLEICNNCGNTLDESSNVFIKPIYGFITELDEVKERMLKPKRTYRSDYYYVGNLSEDDNKADFEGIIEIRLVKENRLAVINDNPFFVCMTCGYAKIDHENQYYPTNKENHKLPRSTINCKNDVLEKRALGHEFHTDVVIIDILEEIKDQSSGYSLLFALLEGISISLDIERYEISGILETVDSKLQIIIFDTVPGGAGHVKRLMDKEIFLNVIQTALAKVSQDCCDESSSCYSCLRNYQNQKLHALLSRGKAKNMLEVIQQHFRVMLEGAKYKIIDRLDIQVAWDQSDVVEIFSDDLNRLEFIKEKGIKLADFAFADIDFYEDQISTLLIWEKERIILVEKHQKENARIARGWKLFELGEIDELIERLQKVL